MVFSTEHQLELPASFPVDMMVSFMAVARSVLLPGKSNAWKEFAGASNLIGWRFRASYEDMTKYTESWRAYRANVSFEEMYVRERALFGMFTAGVSCIESACYAINALVSHPKLLGLPFGEDEQRSCNPIRLKQRLSKHAEAHALAQTLDGITSSQEWALWIDLRNRMTHRSNLPRVTRGVVGAEPPRAKALHFAATSSTPAFEADVSHLEDMFSWLSSSLRDLLEAGLSFAAGCS